MLSILLLAAAGVIAFFCVAAAMNVGRRIEMIQPYVASFTLALLLATVAIILAFIAGLQA